jgi:hypothetical protein
MTTKKGKIGSRKKASKKSTSIKKPKNRTPPGTPPDTILKRYPGQPDTPNINPYTGENVLISYKYEMPITAPVLKPPSPTYPEFVPDSFNININRSNSNVPTYEDWMSTMTVRSEPKEDPIEEYLKLLGKGGKRKKTRKRRGGKRRNTKKYSNPASIPE